MGTYNVSKIEGWLKDFTSAKDKFTNTYYSDYKNSYIRSCNDSAVVKMRNKLNEHYNRISRINSRVKNVWDDFLWDLKVIDNRLAGGKGSTNDSSVGSKLAKLPSLKEYKANLSVRINSASAVVGTVDKIGWSEDKNFWENLDNSMDVIESTAAVTATSVISGIFGLAEDLVDGALWLSTAAVTGAATLFGEEEWANNAQNTMMDAISYDVVGEANKAFYENTSLGRTINERSIIKYDSEVAQSIQNASTKVTEFAAATALTIATGGAAAPVAVLIIGGTGFLIGAGDKAQENFSQKDRNFWGDSKEVAIAGAVKAVEFYSEGQMGAGALKAIGTIRSAGGVKNLFSNMKTVLSNGESSLFTKESLKNGLKATLKDADTYMDSIGAAFNNITYDNKNGIQVNWKGLAKETACNFALNSVFGFIGNAFETKMISGMEKMGIDLKSPDVNSNGMKNTIEGINPKNVEVSSNVKKANVNDNLDALKKEYDELLNKSKESWFVKAKEASDNGWAWDLNKVSEADNIVKRMQELESTLGVKNTGIPESKIYDYSQAKKEADAMVQKMRNEPIPALEKYKVDTNSPEYQKALKDYYSKPSPSGKQDLSQIENPFKKIEPLKLDDFKYKKSSSLNYTSDYLTSNFSKYIYKDTNCFSGLNDQIKVNGLYHFTAHADEILDSGYIKSSGIISSYGTPKTYFFNGIPKAGQIATNIDDLPLRATAVKVNPTDNVLNSKKLKIRNLDDGAISFNGKFDLTNTNASKQYFCLVKENDELVYKLVSKEIYDAYPNTLEGKQIANFLSDKKNINAIKSDYLNELSNNRKTLLKTSETLKNDTKINNSLIRSQKNYYMKDLNDLARQRFLERLDISIKENGMSSFDNCAKKLSITREELLTIFDKKTKEIVENSDFGIRITNENLYNVFKSGEFKNQFETGTTNGVADLSGRTNCEKSLFGVPDNASLSDRPVYGMLFPKLEKSNQTSLNYFKNRYNGRSYGDTVVILKKDKVINDTTITFGDSLTYKVQPTEAVNPKFNGGFNGIYSHINSMDDLENATISDLSDGINAYPEIQLHGTSSHSAENIEKVIFMSPPDKKMSKILKKFNIPFEII